jgi:hypothetical protein
MTKTTFQIVNEMEVAANNTAIGKKSGGARLKGGGALGVGRLGDAIRMEKMRQERITLDKVDMSSMSELRRKQLQAVISGILFGGLQPWSQDKAEADAYGDAYKVWSDNLTLGSPDPWYVIDPVVMEVFGTTRGLRTMERVGYRRAVNMATRNHNAIQFIQLPQVAEETRQNCVKHGLMRGEAIRRTIIAQFSTPARQEFLAKHGLTPATFADRYLRKRSFAFRGTASTWSRHDIGFVARFAARDLRKQTLKHFFGAPGELDMPYTGTSLGDDGGTIGDNISDRTDWVRLFDRMMLKALVGGTEGIYDALMKNLKSHQRTECVMNVTIFGSTHKEAASLADKFVTLKNGKSVPDVVWVKNTMRNALVTLRQNYLTEEERAAIKDRKVKATKSIDLFTKAWSKKAFVAGETIYATRKEYGDAKALHMLAKAEAIAAEKARKKAKKAELAEMRAQNRIAKYEPGFKMSRRKVFNVGNGNWSTSEKGVLPRVYWDQEPIQEPASHQHIVGEVDSCQKQEHNRAFVLTSHERLIEVKRHDDEVMGKCNFAPLAGLFSF